MGWYVDKERYLAISKKYDRSVILTTKDHWYWKVIGVLATVCTFGGIKYSDFMEHFATTIGPLQGYPVGWVSLSEELLVHEARHTTQCRWCGFFIHPWVGVPIYGLLYLLPILPLGLAFFRWRFEVDADKAAYKQMVAAGKDKDLILDLAEEFGETVCGPEYGWAWPRFLGGVSAFRNAAIDTIQKGDC